MTDDVQVEATGETVGEAKWAALRELEKLLPGLDRSLVRFDVLSEGKRGLLGVGYSPARVLAAAAAPAAPAAGPPPEESEVAARVRELVERIVDALGVHCRIDLVEDEDSITASCSGRDLGVLIGKHGQTIDAVQYLVNAIVSRVQPADRKAIVVDASGYRERRRAAVDALALRSAERALATGSRVELEPMTAIERKLVHLCLQDYPGIVTTSEGTEPNRFVVISPQHG